MQEIRGVTIVVFLNNFSNALVDTPVTTYVESMASGIKVLVHAPGTAPNMRDALSIGAGAETTIVVSTTERRRLSTPYSTPCTDRTLVEGSATLTYTFLDCLDVCIQSAVCSTCCLLLRHTLALARPPTSNVI